jgi:beta-glucosidase
VARQTIIDGAVLLKNEGGTLPIAKGAAKIALLGKCAEGATGDASTRMAMHTKLTSLQDALMSALDGRGTEMASSGDASAAKGASVAVVCAMATAADGWDRDNLTLPDVDWLIADARTNRAEKVVVLAIVPGAVTTEWIAGADAVLLLFAPGSQLGPAAATLLVGGASPGGRLPVTLPEADEKRFAAPQYPGECKGREKWCEDMTAKFSEGTLVGYRWNDAKKVKAAFPFGFGLDYTEFSYDNFWVDCGEDAVAVKVTVSNVGGRDGTAVPQAYVQFDQLRPAVRQLRGFRKVVLPAGGKAEVTFVLREEDWRFYDASAGKWKSAVKEGDFITVHVGSSSADLLWKETLSCDFMTLKDNSGLLRPLVMD